MLEYPELGEVFELTIDGRDPSVQPLTMLEKYGYNPKGCEHHGKIVDSQKTSQFKLVQVGFCVDRDELNQRLAVHGKIPEGQWIEAFKAKFSTPDGKGSIGVADASWVGPGGRIFFPCIHPNGNSFFHCSCGSFHVNWRWMVSVG